jgi:hypothetical protein
VIELDFEMDGGLGLRVSTGDVRAAEFYRGEYAWAQGDRAGHDGPAVSLEWHRDRVPEFGQGHYHQHKLLARWRYRMELSPGAVSVSAAGNDMALPMVHHMIVHPSLRWLASFHDRLLLHGSALVHDGRSVIFTGQGGVGKTTTSSILLAGGDDGWQTHADDYTFVTAGGHTEAYLTRAHLYRDLLDWVPSLADRLEPVERLGLEVFGRVRRWSGQRLKWPVRYAVQQLWPDRRLAPEAALAGVFLLARGGKEKVECDRLEDKAGTVDWLIGMNFGEARHFRRLLAVAVPEGRRPGFWDAWRSRERSILDSIWGWIPFFRLTLPRAASGDSRFVEEVQQAVLGAIETGRSATA